MITEEDIAKWPPEQQAEIRKEIQRLVDLGYPREYLRITQLGTVNYDHIRHAEAMESGLDPDSDQRRL